MAITSPSLVLAIPAMFGNIKPRLDALRKLGTTDFSADAPQIDVKPGATLKVPVSSVTAASAYDASTNNYTTGGSTTWQNLTCTHYLQGFDVSGVDLDSGVNGSRIEQLFAIRAGLGIAGAIQGAVVTALDGTTAQSGSGAVLLPATASCTLADFMGLAGVKSWLNSTDSVLAVNGGMYAKIKAVAAAAYISGTDEEIAQALGFRDLVLIPGMTARMCIVPAGSFGVLGRVPAIIARYAEAGTETDPDTGLSVGIVVADDQSTNRRIVNADLWIGCTALTANATASTAGVVKVGQSV